MEFGFLLDPPRDASPTPSSLGLTFALSATALGAAAARTLALVQLWTVGVVEPTLARGPVAYLERIIAGGAAAQNRLREVEGGGGGGGAGAPAERPAEEGNPDQDNFRPAFLAASIGAGSYELARSSERQMTANYATAYRNSLLVQRPYSLDARSPVTAAISAAILNFLEAVVRPHDTGANDDRQEEDSQYEEPTITERLWLTLWALIAGNRPLELSCIPMINSLMFMHDRSLLWKLGATEREITWMSNATAGGLLGLWDTPLADGRPHTTNDMHGHSLQVNSYGGRKAKRRTNKAQRNHSSVGWFSRAPNPTPAKQPSRTQTTLGGIHKAGGPNYLYTEFAYARGQRLSIPTFVDTEGRVYSVHSIDVSAGRETTEGEREEEGQGEVILDALSVGARVWLVSWPVSASSGRARLPTVPAWSLRTETTLPRMRAPLDEAALRLQPSPWVEDADQTAAARYIFALPRGPYAVSTLAEERQPEAVSLQAFVREETKEKRERTLHNAALKQKAKNATETMRLSSMTYTPQETDVMHELTRWSCSVAPDVRAGDLLVLAQNRFVWRYAEGATEIVAYVHYVAPVEAHPQDKAVQGGNCKRCIVEIMQIAR